MEKRKIGIYGGTFSPPHRGHVAAAESFADTIAFDKLIIMPDFLPPHKEFDGRVSAFDRLKMCELAFSHIKNVEVSDMEIKRGGRSYTAVTLEALSEPDVELYFLCGTDMFLTLGEWYAPERIFKSATICYIRRESDSVNDLRIEATTEEYKTKFSAKILNIPGQIVQVSSSEIRDAIKNSQEITRLLPQRVYEYIVKKGFYK